MDRTTPSDMEAVRGLPLLRAQGRIVMALMLRDIRSRFFGSAWGFLIVVAWPLSHILILLGIYALLGRTAPYGDDQALWFATGIVPFMSFSYMSRFIMLGVAFNKPLLTYPVLKITDIIVARAIVEALNAGLVVIILGFLFWGFGIDFMPLDPVEAAYALLASMLLGLGFGTIGATIAGIVPAAAVGYGLFMILLWVSAGVFFVPDALPAELRVPLSYHPVLQCVEWMRSAYYEGYGATILDRGYVVGWGIGTLFLGLAMERLMRGRILLGGV